MKECLLYKTSGDYAQCQACNHYCRIAPFKRGICGVRENQKGKLFSLTYGRIIEEHVEPIEKKPLRHFLPQTTTLSIASLGCNFSCQWCQNWDISQGPKTELSRDEIMNKTGVEMTPDQIVADAKRAKAQSISYTFTEPTVFLELAIETMKLARDEKIKNVWISNGYFSKETFEIISPYLDAINMDLKGFKEDNYLKYFGAKLLPILDNIKAIYKKGIHLEVTTLIVPGVNDGEEEISDIANFLSRISSNIVWHISRFFPDYKMRDIEPTPIKTLKQAQAIGKKAGLKYVYLGNI